MRRCMCAMPVSKGSWSGGQTDRRTRPVSQSNAGKQTSRKAGSGLRGGHLGSGQEIWIWMENERWKDTMGLDAQWRHPHLDSRLTQKSTAAMFSARSCQPVLMRVGRYGCTNRQGLSSSSCFASLCVVLSVLQSPVFLDLVPRNNNNSKKSLPAVFSARLGPENLLWPVSIFLNPSGSHQTQLGIFA